MAGSGEWTWVGYRTRTSQVLRVRGRIRGAFRRIAGMARTKKDRPSSAVVWAKAGPTFEASLSLKDATRVTIQALDSLIADHADDSRAAVAKLQQAMTHPSASKLDKANLLNELRKSCNYRQWILFSEPSAIDLFFWTRFVLLSSTLNV